MVEAHGVHGVEAGEIVFVRRKVAVPGDHIRSEEHTSELQSQSNLVCRLLLEKKKKKHLHKDCEPKNDVHILESKESIDVLHYFFVTKSYAYTSTFLVDLMSSIYTTTRVFPLM